MSNKTFIAKKVKNIGWIVGGAMLLTIILIYIAVEKKSILYMVFACLIPVITAIIILSDGRMSGSGGMIVFTDKRIKANQGERYSVDAPYFEIKTAHLTSDKQILLKKANGKSLGKLNVRSFNYSEIKEILKELQKHGKTIKIDPALEGVFVLDLVPKKRGRHLEV